MRRVALSLTFLLCACGGETPAPKPPATPDPTPTAATTATAPTTDPTAAAAPKKNLMELQQAAGKGLAEAMQNGDAKKMAGFYTQDAVFKMAGMPDMKGRDAIEKGASEWFKSMSKIKMGESRVFVKNEVVISEWVVNATHSGDFMGNKATEKPVGWQGASVVWFNDDGLIKEEHMYWNPATVLFQVGASKDKNRAVPAIPGKPEVVVSQNTPEEEQNITIIQQINTAWENKDEPSWLGLLTDTAEWDDLTTAEPAKGKQGVLKYFKGFATAFPDAKLETQNSWGVGDWVIEEGTYAGTNTGPLYGAPATKKAMTLHELNIIQLSKDDKIVKAVTYGNDLEMLSQLGLGPKPPAAKPADKPAAKPADKPADKPAPKP
jgi:steroid delta-isomerase-like uncharacterized protein